MNKHPTALPDDVARELADLAQSFGYGIEHLTLVWVAKDLGRPMTATAVYTTKPHEEHTIDGQITLWGTL